eukprot:162351-Pelagomonas_calceolata.AAC.3
MDPISNWHIDQKEVKEMMQTVETLHCLCTHMHTHTRTCKHVQLGLRCCCKTCSGGHTGPVAVCTPACMQALASFGCTLAATSADHHTSPVATSTEVAARLQPNFGSACVRAFCMHVYVCNCV